MWKCTDNIITICISFFLCARSSQFSINWGFCRGLNVNQQLKPRIVWWHYRQWQCSCTELPGHLPSGCSTNLNFVSTKISWKGCYSLRLSFLWDTNWTSNTLHMRFNISLPCSRWNGRKRKKTNVLLLALRESQNH